MIDLRKLQHLITVVDAGSFVHAADLLNLSQPALSRSIQALETSYGTPLIERSRGQLRATIVGQQLIREGKRLVYDAQRLHKDLDLWAGGQAGKLSLGVGPMAVSVIGSDFLSTFKKARPMAQVHVEVAEAEGLERMLNSFAIELVVVGTPALTNVRNLIVTPLMRVPMGLLVREGHPLADENALEMTDLTRYPIASSGHFQYMTTTPITPTADVICENFQVLREMALTSDAILVSTPLLANKLGSTPMVVLPRPVGSPFPEAYELVIAHLKHSLSPLAQLAIDVLREHVSRYQ